MTRGELERKKSMSKTLYKNRSTTSSILFCCTQNRIRTHDICQLSYLFNSRLWPMKTRWNSDGKRIDLGGCSHVVPSSHLPLLLWTLWDKNHHWGQGGWSHMILIEILHCRLFLSPTLCSGAAFLSSPYYPSCRWDILKEKYLKCWNQGACGRFLRVHGLHKSVRADWPQETVRFPSR